MQKNRIIGIFKMLSTPRNKGQMCYHKQQRATVQEVAEYYEAKYSPETGELYSPRLYENGFDFKPDLVLTSEHPKELSLISWGLIPWFTKTREDAAAIRLRTLNCVSENAFITPSFRDSMKAGKRCLVPATGFFEWRHIGKEKYPYFIYLKDQTIFSMAGIYSSWTDKTTQEETFSYSVLTTSANPLMEKIHNSKKRMPVIIPKSYEKDWLNMDLTKDDVLALCKPLDAEQMAAYTISKKITDRKISDKNTAAISERFEYPELSLMDS